MRMRIGRRMHSTWRFPQRRRHARRGSGIAALWVICVLLFFVCLIRVFHTQINPVILAVAESKAKSLAVQSINTSVNQMMQTETFDYDKLIRVQRDSAGEVSSLTSNVSYINQMKSGLSTLIEERFSKTNIAKVGIPLGNFFPNDFLSGLGPRVPIKIVPLGYSVINMKNSFETAGINQTKHEVYLEITVSVMALLPVTRTSTSVTTMVPVAETVIVGKVPDNYTSVNGVTGEAQDNVLNLLD